MEQAKQLEFERTRRALYLRFSEEEYSELLDLAHARGQKPQDFIKSIIFHGGDKRPLFNSENSQKLNAEIKRIGNNFNQIAKHLNSGFRRDWSDALENCAHDLEQLRRLFSQNVAS